MPSRNSSPLLSWAWNPISLPGRLIKYLYPVSHHISFPSTCQIIKCQSHVHVQSTPTTPHTCQIESQTQHDRKSCDLCHHLEQSAITLRENFNHWHAHRHCPGTPLIGEFEPLPIVPPMTGMLQGFVHTPPTDVSTRFHARCLRVCALCIDCGVCLLTD